MAPRLLVLLQTGTWPCGCEVTNSETDPSLDSRKEKDAAARNSLLGIFECDMLHDLLAKAEQLLNKRLGWLQKWSKTAEGHRETDFFFVRGDEAQQDGSAGGRHAHPRSRLADEPFGGRPPSAAATAPRPSYCSPEARDLLLTLADVLLENFETCPLALRSDRVVVGAYAAHADRERFRAATRCDGLTLDGVRCRLTSAHQGPNAAPLRCGGTRCVHHQPDKFTGTQCAGYTTRGRRCRVFSASGYEEAKPLRLGLPLCRWHTTQWTRAVYCAGVRKDGSPCGTASWHSHPGAQPLRDGSVFCAKHALPADEHCASCGATEGALRHDPQTPLPGLVPASHPRTTSRWYCEPCWSVYEASSDDDAECSEQCVPCASPSE